MINKVNVFMCEIFHRSFLNKTKKKDGVSKTVWDTTFKNSYNNHYKGKTNDSSKRQNRFQIHGNNWI